MLAGEDIRDGLLGENFYRRLARHFKRAALNDDSAALNDLGICALTRIPGNCWLHSASN